MKKRDKRNKNLKVQRKSEKKSIAYSYAVFQPCCLCKSPTANTGTFIPDKQATYGAIPGKVRTFAYALCDECMAMGQESLAKVEQKIEAHWRAAFTRKVWHLDREDGTLKQTIYSLGPKPGMN